jgi:hypothetical protein
MWQGRGAIHSYAMLRVGHRVAADAQNHERGHKAAHRSENDWVHSGNDPLMRFCRYEHGLAGFTTFSNF